MNIFLLLTIASLSLFQNLDPHSVSQNLAFYELYPDTKEGKASLKRALELLGSEDMNCSSIPKASPNFLINLINKESSLAPKMSEEELSFIVKLGSKLKNRKLKGHGIWDEKETIALPAKEIDLARAVFLAEGLDQYQSKLYESLLDLMALQVLARLDKNASDVEKINALNFFIFHEMRFRFPPHSLWSQKVDAYTFLPSVIDSRRGVCLGVSVLYLCLAQRLDLNLEIITPPGHIYLRKGQLNIETTARGINLPTATYLGIETRKSELRNIKEVVGMVLMNKAAIFWKKEDYQTAVNLYEQASRYVENDLLLKELYAYNLLFVGKKDEGKAILFEIKDQIADHAVFKETIPEDYLNGRTDEESIKTVFMQVDEKRSSILSKQEALKKVIAKYPLFRAGLLQLASTYLQLGRDREAISILSKYESIDALSGTVNYYLAALLFDRIDYKGAWKYLKKAEEITSRRAHHPKALQVLRRSINRVCPDS